jgi:hypothetical protein
VDDKTFIILLAVVGSLSGAVNIYQSYIIKKLDSEAQGWFAKCGYAATYLKELLSTWKRDDGKWITCRYCGESWMKHLAPEKHKYNCPYVRARAFISYVDDKQEGAEG